MKKPMNNNNGKGLTPKTLAMFAAMLLLTACDGGIFGTGGGPDMIPPTENDSSMDAGSPPLTSEAGDTDDAASSGTATSGTEGAQNTTGGSTTTDGGTVGSTDGDTTGQGTTADSSTENSDGAMNPFPETEITTNAQFINETAVLSTAEARLNVVNASNLTINVFETSVQPDSVLFNENGIASQSISNSVSLMNNESSLDFVDNNALGELLGSYSQFDAADATLSTVFVRQLDATFYLNAAATQTSTSDAGLTKIRVVQASALNNAETNAQFMLLATGDNSSGVDASFDPISFFTPVSPYLEVPAGDYEFTDELGRKDNETFSLSGGTVYTITVLGPDATPSLLNNDSASAN